jgi:hypothetical protein
MNLLKIMFVLDQRIDMEAFAALNEFFIAKILKDYQVGVVIKFCTAFAKWKQQETANSNQEEKQIEKSTKVSK